MDLPALKCFKDGNPLVKNMVIWYNLKTREIWCIQKPFIL